MLDKIIVKNDEKTYEDDIWGNDYQRYLTFGLIADILNRNKVTETAKHKMMFMNIPREIFNFKAADKMLAVGVPNNNYKSNVVNLYCVRKLLECAAMHLITCRQHPNNTNAIAELFMYADEDEIGDDALVIALKNAIFE